MSHRRKQKDERKSAIKARKARRKLAGNPFVPPATPVDGIKHKCATCGRYFPLSEIAETYFADGKSCNTCRTCWLKSIGGKSVY